MACSFCAMTIFSANREIAITHSKSLYYCGVILQSYFIYIVVRDLLITMNIFMRGPQSRQGNANEALIAVVLIHYFSACLDNLVISGFAIWGTISLNSLEAAEFENADVETGLPAFVTITTLNVIMAILYACSHVFALPIAVCIMSCFPDRLREYMAS